LAHEAVSFFLIGHSLSLAGLEKTDSPSLHDSRIRGPAVFFLTLAYLIQVVKQLGKADACSGAQKLRNLNPEFASQIKLPQE